MNVSSISWNNSHKMILNTELNWTMKVDSRNYAESVLRTFVGMNSKNWPGYFNCSTFQLKVCSVIDSRIISVSITFTTGSNWVEDRLESTLWKVWGIKTKLFWSCKKQKSKIIDPRPFLSNLFSKKHYKSSKDKKF